MTRLYILDFTCPSIATKSNQTHTKMAKLRDVVQKADANDQVKTEVKDTLNLLYADAQKNAEKEILIMKERLITEREAKDPTYIPITVFINEEIFTRAVTAKTTDPLKGLLDGVKDVFSGDAKIATGIADVLKNSLDAVLGTAEGTEMEKKRYEVVVELPAIVRYDIYLWSRTVKSAGLKQELQKAVACGVVKSAVDVTKISFATFISVYGEVLRKGYGADPSEILRLIKKAKEVFVELGGKVDDPSEENLKSLVQQILTSTPPDREYYVATRRVQPNKHGLL